MNEVIEAAKNCGYTLPGDVVVEYMKRTETMGDYKPSTLLDFEAGRALEVEAIWGEPLRRAQANGAAMPRLEQLYALLKSLNARARMRHRLPPSIEVRNLQRIVRISTRRLQDVTNI